MRFVKKLVILTGNGARGTLMLEKNGTGVWARLNLFDFKASGKPRLAIISGNDLFYLKLDSARTVEFKLGEISFEEIHAAVVTDRVLLYGSNCAAKLSEETIMQKLKKVEAAQSEAESAVTFSGREKKIDDYFKEIAPPVYDDFALADKNYYPAYVSATDEETDDEEADERSRAASPLEKTVAKPEEAAKSEGEGTEFTASKFEGEGTKATSSKSEGEGTEFTASKSEREGTKATFSKFEGEGAKATSSKSEGERAKATSSKSEGEGTEFTASKPEEAAKTEEIKRNKTEVNMERQAPHELEQKYLRLMEMAAKSARDDFEREAASTEVKITEGERKPDPPGEVKISEVPKINLPSEEAADPRSDAEKPEVIAMARRVTLRDYRVEDAKPAGRRATYFERSSAQLDKLMNGGERYPLAEKLIPGSRFVKVKYDSKRYYVVGVIGRDYICYGVPAAYSAQPPEPLRGYARWLPFDRNHPQGEGLWMMYQDGISGETLRS